MRASLDTNVIIHFYKAGLENILFNFFDEGVFIYEQIRNIELYTDQKSLLQFEDNVMTFTFADVLILRYLVGDADENQTVNDFNMINNSSSLNWSFKSQVSKFIKRFLKDPYRNEDKEWILDLTAKKGFSIKVKLEALSKLL